MTREPHGYLGDIGLLSLFRSPFLIPSLLLHAMLFFSRLAGNFLNRKACDRYADFGTVNGSERRRL